MVRYTQKVVIVGAGISGLACAYRLKQVGVQSLVLEGESRAGGVIATTRRNGHLFELGPQCPRFASGVWRLVQELGLANEFLAGDPKAKRYIFSNGQLHLAPFSPWGLLATGLLKVSSKVRILTEVFSATKPPAQEESLAEFVARKFGADTLENLVDPLIATVFFGDSYKMGMESAFPALVEWEREHGSLVRGALRARASRHKVANRVGDTASPDPPNAASRSLKVTDALPSLGSFQNGMARLPEKLSEHLREEIRYGVRVEHASRRSGEDTREASGWQVEASDDQKIFAEHLILSVPAYDAERILERGAPALAAHLGSIEYAPMQGVSSVYERSQVENPLNGFGFLVPRKEGMRTICTFWNSSLFPQRAPEGKVLMTSFVRRARDGEEFSVKEEASARVIERENAMVLGIAGEPKDREVWSQPRALPQYNVGHAKTIAAIRQALPDLPHLYLASNYLKGRSIGDCVDVGFEAAKEVHSCLEGKHIKI